MSPVFFCTIVFFFRESEKEAPELNIDKSVKVLNCSEEIVDEEAGLEEGLEKVLNSSQETEGHDIESDETSTVVMGSPNLKSEQLDSLKSDKKSLKVIFFDFMNFLFS